MATGKTIIQKTARVLSWILISAFFLVVAAIIFINLPAGKKAVKNRVEKYLSEKLQTKVKIGYVDYSLPKWLKIKNLYVEDQKKDTLLYGEELRVDLNMLDLLKGNTNIRKVVFKNMMANISRSENDSVFNYQFIVNAFTGNKSSTPNKDTAEMKLSLDHLVFDKVAFTMNDRYAGNEMKAIVHHLDLTTKKFQPDRLNFGVDQFFADSLQFSMRTYKELPAAPTDHIDTGTVTPSPYQLFISANRINVRHADVIIDNQVTGLYYANAVTNLYGKNALFSMAQSRGTADSLLLDSSAIIFSAPKKITTTTVVKDSVPTTLPWYFAANRLDIKNTQLKLDDNNKPAAKGLDFSHLDVKELAAAINYFRYSADTTTGSISQLHFKDAGSGFALDTTHANLLFTNTKLIADELYVKTPNSVIQKSFQLSYDSIPAITKYPQNSLVAAVLDHSTIAFNDLYLLVPAMESSLPKDQFANQYISFNTELRGNLQRLYIPYLELSGLSGSKLRGKGTLYNLTDPRKFSYDLFIDQSVILKRDLVRFVPPENRAQFADLPDIISLRGKITGNKKDLSANVIASAKDLAFTGRVNLKNISDPARLSYDLALTKATVSKNIIQGFLPPELLQQLNLPDQISAAGKFSGDKNNIVTDLKLGSNYGPLTAKGFIKNISDPQHASYDMFMSTPGFNIGRLVKQDSVLGTVAGNFRAKGTGFDYKTMRSSVHADVASLEYNKYNYHNALIDADFNNGIISSKGNIKDSSLRLNYDLMANVQSEYPAVTGNIRIDTAELNRLHFTKDTLNFSLTANIDAKNLRPRNLDANILLDSIRMQSGKNFYQLDSTSLVASSSNGADSIILKGPIAEIHAGGAFDYDKIGYAVLNYVNGYYKIPGYQPVTNNIPEQQFAVKGVIRSHPIIKGFVPGLEQYSDINFTGSYASADTDSALSFHATVPQLSYAGNHIGNGIVDIGSKNGRINYDLGFDTLKTAGNILYATNINGGAARDSLSLNAVTKDAAGRDWFGIAGSAFVNNDTYSFRLQDSLILNYEKWKVAPDNYLQYSPAGIVVNNFNISSDTASIVIKSRELVPNSPIDVNIDNFNLRSISTLVNSDTVFLAGILDAKATVSDLDKTLPGFTGNASVTDLAFMQHPLGNMTAHAEKISNDEVSAELNLTGNGNDLTAKGNYYLSNSNNQFDADLQVRQLSFRTIEAFTAGQITGSRGNISGNIRLDGKFSDPHYNGQLNFDTVRFATAQLGTPYFIDKQKVVFSYPTISFPNFIVKDSLNHELKINGDITSRSMTDYDLNLDFNANDFVLVNAKRTINSEVYGFASVDVNASVTGTSAAPDIEGDISLNDKSDVHIILPEASYAKNDGNEIVRFIDRDTFNINPPPVLFEPARKSEAAFAQFLNYNLNIELTKGAALTILVDPVTGDEIKVQGDARLNAGVDPGGHLVLAGVYELDRGYYDLHYQFLNRKFNLIKGSTITFAGAPLQATANITAEYIANTNSINLLTNEITDVSPTLSNSFNQQLPFHVVLYITGTLAKPNISFDIQLPESNNLLNNDLRTTIENKLQQIRQDPAAVNKQVFSLLLFNRFVSEESSDFFKGNGSDFNDLARQSVSQFLSSALNQIAGDIFKGIDVDLNLNSYNDFSNGGNTERTDLSITVSKSFANDRVTVSVGQNFGLQGQDAAAKAGASAGGFRPDINVSYKLTSDGKYMIRAYTRNQFEVVLDGYVVETGLAFVVTMDYNKFKELFRRKKKK